MLKELLLLPILLGNISLVCTGTNKEEKEAGDTKLDPAFVAVIADRIAIAMKDNISPGVTRDFLCDINFDSGSRLFYEIYSPDCW